MKIQVILRNLSPIFSAAPGATTISIEGVIGAPAGLPFVRARTMTVPAIRGDEVRPVQLPIVPGNTMRNLLRRTILDEIILPALEGKTSLSVGAYAAAYAGNASGNPEGVPATFDEVMTVRNHVFLGLFGGGPRMQQGRLSVDSLYPIHPDACRIIADGFEDRFVTGRILDIVWQRRVDPIRKITEAEQASVIQGGTAAVTQWVVNSLKASMEAAEKRKGKKAPEQAETDQSEAAEPKARGLTAMNAHEVVIPGVDWLLRLDLDNPTREQVGLVLLGLSLMQKKTIAGGHAKGYGKFRIEEITLDGDSVWDGSGYTATPNVLAAIDAATAAVDNLKGEDFEKFIQSSKAETVA